MTAESQFIDEIARIFSASQGGVEVGIGDDCALIAGSPRQLATIDAQVEHVHFERVWIDGETLGARLFLVNLSDITACAGSPRHALFSAAFGSADREYVLAVARGLAREAALHSCAIAGGNVSNGALQLHLALLGALAGDRMIERSGAKSGDLVYVTGTVGDAAAGLELLRAGTLDGALVQRWRRPPNRTSLAAAMGKHASAAIDVSDGLAQDLGHIAVRSKLTIQIEAAQLPLSEALRAHAGLRATALALQGGEDYEIAMTCPPEHALDLESAAKRLGIGLTRIGACASGLPRVSVQGYDGPLQGHAHL